MLQGNSVLCLSGCSILPPQKICSILSFTSWMKLILDTVTLSNFVINEFNPTFEVEPSTSISKANFWHGGYSCLWASLLIHSHSKTATKLQLQLHWSFSARKIPLFLFNYWNWKLYQWGFPILSFFIKL